jgi:hypothetical protein
MKRDESVVGAVKKFGVDPLKSKLGTVPPPLKGFAKKEGGLPFTPSTPINKLGTIGSGHPVPLKGLETKETDMKRDESVVGAVKKFGVDPLKSKLGTVPPPLKAFAAEKESTVLKESRDEVSDTEDDSSVFFEEESERIDADVSKPFTTYSRDGSIRFDDDEDSIFASSGPRVKKEVGTGLPFEPKAFSPPRTRSEPKDPNVIDVSFESSTEEEDLLIESKVQSPKNRPPSQSVPINLWGGESFKGTVSSRSYGLGYNRPLSSESKASGDTPSLASSKKLDQNARLETESDNKVDVNENANDHDATSNSPTRGVQEDKEASPTSESLEMERRIGLLEEQNRLLGEKLQASKVEDHRQQAEKQSISKEIEKLMDHMKRLENEVTDSAAKSERAIRSREDEIKTMAEVIQIKTNKQSSLEAITEKLLREIDEIRLSTEKQTKKDMETLKNSLLESAKQELSEMKVVHKRQMDDITMKLKVKLEQENVLVKTTRAQSEQLKELKDQIIRLQQERTSPSDLSGGENGASPASNNKLDQMNVEEVMETIQNIDPLHNIVLASDDASEKSVDSSRNDIPRYETFSRGKHTLQYVVLLNIYIQTSCHCL